MTRPEFDRYSTSYEKLLKNPIRDRFAEPGSEFFHIRKRDLIRGYFRSRKVDTQRLRYLDIGCGRGELLSLLRGDFDYVAGCDPSQGMLNFADIVDTRVQDSPDSIPFASSEFDFVSAVCVYHHVPVAARLTLTREVHRVLKPGGVFSIIEHNPYNPVTRLIVSKLPVDVNAVLLGPAEARKWMSQAQLRPDAVKYFLIFPELLYTRGARIIEEWLDKVPLGGQYAVFGHKGGITTGSNHAQ